MALLFSRRQRSQSILLDEFVEYGVAIEPECMVVGEEKVYQQVQGLSTDPTADSSDDDFKEAPLPSSVLAQFAVGECGVRASVGMTAADATHMLHVSRSSGKVRASTSRMPDADVSHADFPLIPPLLFALLMSVYDSPGELSRVLRQDWVSGWEGWAEADRRFDRALCAEDENKIAEELVVRFARVSMANVHERFISDSDRVRQLASENLHVGKGEAYGANNACLADSLLQLLMRHDVVNCPVFDTVSAEKQWRRDACLAVRAHLCNHTDVTLQPRQRDHTSAVVHDASAEDHALAYLEHHRHGIEIIIFS